MECVQRRGNVRIKRVGGITSGWNNRFWGLIHKAHSDDLTKIICDKLSEFWNFTSIQTIFPKNGIQKEFRHFVKNPNSQIICHFSVKNDIIRQNGQLFWLNFQQLFSCWIQQIFLLVLNCLNSAKKSKAISATSVSSLAAFGNSIFMTCMNFVYELHATFSSCHFCKEVKWHHWQHG